jgi:hypothetical protein
MRSDSGIGNIAITFISLLGGASTLLLGFFDKHPWFPVLMGTLITGVIVKSMDVGYQEYVRRRTITKARAAGRGR